MSMWPRHYNPPVPPRLPLDRVFRFVAGHYGVTTDELKGGGKANHLVNGRSVVAKILRDRGCSYPLIARLLGFNDHTTARHLIKTFDNRAKFNSEIPALYSALRVAEGRRA